MRRKPAAPQAVQNDTTKTPGLPQAPDPAPTQPLFLRDTSMDYTHLKTYSWKHPLLPYTPTGVPEPRLSNTPKLDDLLRDGKLYLSLPDALVLALENNYDIAIARINLDIADTDILRTMAGSTFRGVSTGLITNTLGGSTSTITGGGGPGGTSTASGGAASGASGLVLSTNGGGPLPYNFDPTLTGTTEFERATTQSSSVVQPSATSNTLTSNYGYQQGFSTGSLLNVGFNNTRLASNSTVTSLTPALSTTLRATFTQHLLQGFGPKLNKRFILEATNNRRITDSAFRQQILYTIAQVESIYWSLVSAYEDEQSKERALTQSTQLTADNRRQLEIGTLAPLDVVTSDSAVATDKQALITSKSNLEYQQLLMKQAIARNLNDPQLANAPVVPTDRVSLDLLPEESMQVEDLVKAAYTNNPQIEQAVINMQNNQITIRGEKNGLAAGCRCVRVLRHERAGRNSKSACGQPDWHNHHSGSGEYDSGWLSWRAAESVRRAESGLRLWREHHDSDPEPYGAGGSGALSDGVSPVADAVAAALHADSHPGDQRAVCVDQ